MLEKSKKIENKERLLAEAKAVRRDMKLGKSAALLIRENRDTRCKEYRIRAKRLYSYLSNRIIK